MDSDFDITLNPAESSEESSPKGHFLESLGLGGRDLFGGAVAARGDVSRDDGMVLSSLPDDLGFPMAGSSPERGFMASVRMEPSRNERVESISLPLEDEPQPEPDESIEVSSSSAPDSCDPDETLHMHCPECRGSLVLKRLHLGVEGACVWCHTPIVAAESSRDGIVRVFPILGHAGTPSSQPSPAADPRESAKDLTASAVVEEPARPHTGAPASESTPAPAVGPELPTPAPIGFGELTPAPEPASASLASGGFEYSAAPAPAPKAEPVPETSALPEGASFGSGFIAPDFSITPPTAPAEEPSESSSDLESLYETGGFLAMKPAPSQEVSPELHVPREMAGFDGPASSFSLPAIDAPNLKPMATVETPAAPAPAPAVVQAAAAPAPEMAGFGSFLQMPQANPEQGVPSDTAPAAAVSEPAPESGFHTPTPWGPPTPVTSVIPAATSPTAAPASTPVAEPKATGALPSGFASGFGALSPLPESAAPAASAPAPESEPPTAPSWEAAFGSASATSGIDLAPISTPAAGSDIPKGFGETFL